MNLSYEGVLDFNTVVFAENPTTLLERTDFHGYEFEGLAGGVVTITMTGKTCGAPDTVLSLFKPENANGDRGTSLIENDDAFLTCFLDSQIRQFRLPVTGNYLIVATSFIQAGGGHYRLQLTCNNNACVPADALTFGRTRIQQTAIDAGQFSPNDLFDIGDFLFEAVFSVENGMGNAVVGLPGGGKPRPNFRESPAVHFAAFGAPEAQSCITCHNEGGDDGAGDLNHNSFQIGDGVNRASGVPRNPPPLLGMGLRQAVAAEMSAELAALITAAKTQAKNTNTNVTVALRPPTNPVNFGTAIVRPDQTVDLTGIVGIDADLVVKPFGWKGREATVRRFIEGGFRVHFGMQTEPSVNKHCITPNTNTFGTGTNCQDPDADGVQKEISDGQLSAQAIYLAMLEMPVRVPAANATAQTRVNQGETLFNQVGCQGCHRQNIKIKVPKFVEKGDTTTGAGFTINFATDMRDPKPAVAADGSMMIEVWSDFKRREMGPALADSKPFNQISATQFVTPPLWGIRDTAPYLHDGRAKDLFDAIVLHGGGDDVNSVNAFKALTADQQLMISEFLRSLGRSEELPYPAPPTIPKPIPLPPPLPLCVGSELPPVPSTASSSTGDCPDTVCGLNGMWLGVEVPFRTLHTDPSKVNERNLSIIDAFDENGNGLALKVVKDVLMGRRFGTTVYVEAQPGWRFDLGIYLPTMGPSPKYEIYIKNVYKKPFWAQPTSNSDQYRAYEFTAVDARDGCRLEVCRPGLATSNGHPDLEGTAVIFHGDLYLDNYTVIPSPDSGYDSDTFNMACIGTTLSKLHLLRHTTASDRSNPPFTSTAIPNVGTRQTLMKLLAADYCGSGILLTQDQQPFTTEGHPIRVDFPPEFLLDYPLIEGYTGGMSSVEAKWTLNGASCIDTPRLRSGASIQEACSKQQEDHIPGARVLPSCASLPASEFTMRSGNPNP